MSLVLPVQRVQCRFCQAVRQVKLGFADERRSYCRAFERYVLSLSRCMTILDIARHLLVSWDTIKDIQKRYLKKRFAKLKLKHLKRLAIDEIAVEAAEGLLGPHRGGGHGPVGGVPAGGADEPANGHNRV